MMRPMKTIAVLLLLGGVAHAEADSDQALLSSPSCKAFSAGIQREAGAVTPQPGTSPEKLVADMLARVKTTTPPAEWKKCSAAFQHGMDAYRSVGIEAEAKTVLNRVSTGLATHLVESGKMCPSTRHPAPAELQRVAKGAYAPTAADWSDPAWSCAEMINDLTRQHFQYELKTTSASAEIIARGFPVPGKLVTFTRTGKVDGTRIRWGELVRK